jgi:uncharacterized protein YraI
MFEKNTCRFISRLILCLFILLVAGCQIARETGISIGLEPNNPTLVSFPLIAASQIYAFSADSTLPTQITLSPITPNLDYTAELRDSSGNMVATLIGSNLTNAMLTVAPGQGLYEVAIKSEKQDSIGMLSVQVARSTSNPITTTTAFKSASTINPAMNTALQPVAYIPNTLETTCAARSSVANNVNIRSGPGTTYAVIGMLANGATILVTGQSAAGWFQVESGEETGWVSGSVVALEGQCSALPDVTPTGGQNTVAQAGVFDLKVDRDGWGNVSNQLIYSDVNRRHLILLAVTNMTSDPPDNYREFTLTLLCNGTGVDYIRWGAPENPTRSCGGSVVMPITMTYNQQWIAVTLPDASAYSDVHYTLMTSRQL